LTGLTPMIALVILYTNYNQAHEKPYISNML
jgi:hypothetical protein